MIPKLAHVVRGSVEGSHVEVSQRRYKEIGLTKNTSHLESLGDTLPETNSSPLKMDGWNTTFLLGRPIFRGYVSFREGRNLS